MAEELRIAGIVEESVVDGPGIRFVVFAQGCRHNCPGCHNPSTHSFTGGRQVSVGSILEKIKRNPILDGITISGGEPFEQAKGFARLARESRLMGLNVMTYTGYTYEEIIGGSGCKAGWRELLEQTDILVDGRFEIAKRNLMLRFRGSENQRIIDVRRSIVENRVVTVGV